MSDELAMLREIHELDDILTEAQAAAGVDSPADLIAWIKERKAEDWQPIETAPKDGTHILLYAPAREHQGCSFNARLTYGYWWYADDREFGEEEEFWFSEDGGFLEELPPTHWRPLPKGPKPDAEPRLPTT